ncbi:patatin-like phospholipase family protein [Roseomonas sp. OT10]|uniref:patatin-like phospholipase family protein n=1 Tax=Roseomonas cutis TaxID=2897332 RepID=UPI001E5EC690|nr:patatin-like phospholipase family protein [Roseomonas sp. OT10]UFN48479.1 patatin-like phospholipase family protein [Roseomonas sp. OT10]
MSGPARVAAPAEPLSRRALLRGAGTVLLAGPAACGSISRLPDPGRVPVSRQADGFASFRFNAHDRDTTLAFIDRTADARTRLGLGKINALALSGGGASGAYGAGLLVGWTRSGQRPVFDLVTGVSTGALTAPFAFLGSDWDARLEAAYTDGTVSGLLASNLPALVLPSLYSGEPLAELVARHVDMPLLRAVAQAHARGRRLMVATTNLDTQETVIWDMGAIAHSAVTASYGDECRRLFRQVLVASASIPGVFPPVIITPPSPASEPQEEMHVDGAVTAPFFLAPEALILWRPTSMAMQPGELYAIVNGTVGPTYATTEGAFFAILWRSYDTMSKATTRAHLNASAAFAERNGASFRYAAIPDSLGPDSLDFRPAMLRDLFDLGVHACETGEAFRTLAEAPVMTSDDAVRPLPPAQLRR